MVLSTCLSFLNDVMASEPFFKERSDAVKMSETPYPTNGSGKNLAKDTGIKKAGIPGKSDFSLISYARLNIFFVLHLEKTNLSSLIWYSSDQISP